MKKSLSVLVALICGTVATVMASRWLNAQSDGASIAMSNIFVAVTTIEVGDEITPERIKLEQWPADRVPSGSSGELADIEGKYAKQRFYEGEPIMPIKLMDDNWTEVPKSYRVVAMRASDSGIANLIQPGDRVDVTAFFDKSDLFPSSTTRTVLRGVRVYALDGDTERRVGEDRPKSLKNIQLLIHQDETEAWELAQQLGKVNLLVSSEAATDEEGKEASQGFTDWLQKLQDDREAERLAERKRNTFMPQRPTPVKTETKKEEPKQEGFRMTKHSGGRVLEYLIVPGQLPKLIGEVGENTEDISDSPSGSGSGSGDPATSTLDESEADASYSYLNGNDSPFFQGGQP